MSDNEKSVRRGAKYIDAAAIDDEDYSEEDYYENEPLEDEQIEDDEEQRDERRFLEYQKDESLRKDRIEKRDAYVKKYDKSEILSFEQYRAHYDPRGSESKLFLITTSQNKEFHVINRLEDKGLQYNLRSCFTPSPGSKWVYCELSHGYDLRVLCENINFIRGIEQKSIPYSQQRTIFSTIKETYNFGFRKGEFVKIKRLPAPYGYDNDIAQVIKADLNNNTLVIRFVPRIDYDKLNAYKLYKQSDLNKKMSNKTYMAPRTIFEPEKIDYLPNDNDDDDSTSDEDHLRRYDGFTVVNGLFQREVSYNIVKKLTDVDRSQLTIFKERCTEENREDVEFMKNMNFALGLTVEGSVNREDHAIVLPDHDNSGCIVEVKDIDEYGIATCVPINPPRDFPDIKLYISRYSLKKYFRKDETVQIINGTFKGKKGIIEAVDEKTAILLIRDLNRTEIVSITDISHNINRSDTKNKLGKYNIFNLVKLQNNQVGVIFRIEGSNLFVLTDKNFNNSSEPLSLSNVKDTVKDSSPCDCHGNRIMRDDTIFPNDDPSSKFKVIHCTSKSVFVHSDKIYQCNGVKVFNSQKVTKVKESTGKEHNRTIVSSAGETLRKDLEYNNKKVRVNVGEDKGRVAQVLYANDSVLQLRFEDNHSTKKVEWNKEQRRRNLEILGVRGKSVFDAIFANKNAISAPKHRQTNTSKYEQQTVGEFSNY